MTHRPRTSTVVLVVVCGLFLTAKIALDRRVSRPSGVAMKELSAGYQATSLKRSSLGFDNCVADLLWIKLLQEASHQPLKPGEVSWEYAQIAAITALDPKFKQAYDFGAIFLSVFRRDNLGAKLLLERWVQRDPRNWRTHYLLGYHLYFEMGQYEAASRHIVKAASLERAPPFLPALGVRLLSHTGSLFQALQLSLDLFPGISDPEGKDRLVKRIRSLRFEMQKAAWTEALALYRKRHAREPKDLEELRPLVTEATRELASVLESQTVPEEVVSLLAENFVFRYDRGTKSVVSVRSAPELGIDQLGIYRPKP